MSSKPIPLLSGHVEPEETEALRRKVVRLEADLQEARTELRNASRLMEDSRSALTNLRRQLEPLHGALRQVFGELDAAGIQSGGSNPSPSSTAQNANPKWDFWKNKLGGRQAEFIDLFLAHGEMTTAQLIAAGHCSRDTVGQVVFKLNRAGILNKVGRGAFALKEL